jgi:hypothetical protein
VSNGKPDLMLMLTCTTANNGYAVGDRVYIPVQQPTFTVLQSGVTWTLRTGTVALSMTPKAGGAAVAITPASWTLTLFSW